MSPLFLRACPHCGQAVVTDADGDASCLNGHSVAFCRRCGSGVLALERYVDDAGDVRFRRSCGKCGTVNPYPKPAEEPRLPGDDAPEPIATETQHLKRCPRCAENRPLSDYRKDARKSHGRASYCRDCERSYWQDWSKRTGRTRGPRSNEGKAT